MLTSLKEIPNFSNKASVLLKLPGAQMSAARSGAAQRAARQTLWE